VLSADWAEEGGGLWSYRLAQLGPGERRSLSFVLRLPSQLDVATIRNVVQVSDDGSAGPDPNPADNTAEDEDQLRHGALGDRIWFDANADGQQGIGEVGVEGLLVQLLDPASLDLIAEQITGADGAYRFAGLRLGAYAVQVAPSSLQSGPYAGYRPSADPLPSTLLTPAQSSDMRLDIGLHSPATTEVSLASLSAREAAGGVVLRWQTVAERNNAGFRLLRAASADRASATPIGYLPSQGSQGGSYSFSDEGPLGEPRFYWLVAVEFGGREEAYGPVSPLPALSGQQQYTIYLPIVTR
jgi:SdrD B-like domain